MTLQEQKQSGRKFYKVVVATTPEGQEDCEECQKQYREPIIEAESFAEAEEIGLGLYDYGKSEVVVIEKYREPIVLK